MCISNEKLFNCEYRVNGSFYFQSTLAYTYVFYSEIFHAKLLPSNYAVYTSMAFDWEQTFFNARYYSKG